MGIEYQNEQMQSIYHDEGRLVRIGNVWQSEYVLKDHLGNARVMFRDMDNNGNIAAHEVTQEAHYYPFGMRIEATDAFVPTLANAIPYLYNGIEHIGDLGLDINTAFYRTLDPALGRWWQIDPKAEALKSLSPYNAMNNNPVSFNDPNGDFAVGTILACAVVGGLVNTFIQEFNGKINSSSDFFKSFGIGALNGAMIGMGAPSMEVGIIRTILNSVSSILPSFSIGESSLQLSISPSLMYGSGGFSIGANINMGMRIGDGYVGFGAGVSYYTNNYSTGGTPLSGLEIRGSIIGGIVGKDGSLLLGVNEFDSGKSSQQTGIIRASLYGFHLGYENDGSPFDKIIIPKGSDGYRTAALSLGYKDFEVECKLFTGYRDMNASVSELEGQGYSPHGWVSNPEINEYRLGALTIGYQGYKLGWNSDGIRHAVQNVAAHHWFKPQAWIPRMPLSRPFVEYKPNNLFSYW